MYELNVRSSTKRCFVDAKIINVLKFSSRIRITLYLTKFGHLDGAELEYTALAFSHEGPYLGSYSGVGDFSIIIW